MMLVFVAPQGLCDGIVAVTMIIPSAAHWYEFQCHISPSRNESVSEILVCVCVCVCVCVWVRERERIEISVE